MIAFAVDPMYFLKGAARPAQEFYRPPGTSTHSCSQKNLIAALIEETR